MGESKKLIKPVMTRLDDEDMENYNAVDYIESPTCGDENISKNRVDALCINEQNQIYNDCLDVDVGLDATPSSTEVVEREASKGNGEQDIVNQEIKMIDKMNMEENSNVIHH